MLLAWRTAAFTRMEKLAAPDKFLIKGKGASPKSGSVEQHTVEQQRASIHMLQQLYGGRIGKTRLVKKEKAGP